MLDALLQLGLFTAKSLIIVVLILMVLIVFFILIAKSKEKFKGHLTIKSLNKKYEEISEELMLEILPRKHLKQFLKQKKQEAKDKDKAENTKHVFVLTFHGDIKASGVCNLREEVNAILNIATPNDEIVVRIDSPGGIVPNYGLGAAQLMRIREKNIPLTVTVDRVAASGGYLMACVANKILAAPFAIVGSIGVIVQLPNFHRLLKEKHIDFEQLTAGEFKRTITMFGHNSDEGRQKLHEEIEDIHQQFKHVISSHRPMIDIKKVATGEHWLARQAIDLKLVDEIKTSDEYLLERCKDSNVYEICYEIKKPLLSKLSATASMMRDRFLLGI